MSRLPIYDQPISNPDNDLLGMKEYASTLAEYLKTVTPPFILGVYGQWGEGKTSFVELMRYHLLPEQLEEETKASQDAFITFQAWPYTTSDELWRGLILQITGELCKGPPDQQKQSHAPGRSGLITALGRFLRSKALPLDEPKEDERQEEDECTQLLDELDQNLARSISRRSDSQLQLNQEMTLMAVGKGVLAALSSVSPLAAGIRSLLRIDTSVSLEELFQKEKTQAIDQKVKSVEELRRIFRTLFQARARGRRIYVFIDDLDRCLPDVALDLLEAIRVFLADVNCIFIVAADENLIGQGLRLRYKDLMAGGNLDQVEAYLRQKGQEYFEKIIQFGVRVPACTPEQTHTFITAQFPQWMPATDIIRNAIGDNPRRLKQYCSLLSFKRDVSEQKRQQQENTGGQQDQKEQAWRNLFDKLIKLNSWEATAQDILVRIASRGGQAYKDELLKLESWLDKSANDQAAEGAYEDLKEGDVRELYNIVYQSEPLLKLFRQEPRFSEANPSQVETLRNLVDIAPHPLHTLYTQDRPFMRFLESALLNIQITEGQIIQEDFTKLDAFHEMDEEASNLLHELANSVNWKRQIAILDASHIPIEINLSSGEELSDIALRLQSRLSQNPSLRQQFVEPPYFSTMLKDEILLFHDLKPMRKPAAQLLSKSALEKASQRQQSSRVAHDLLQDLLGVIKVPFHRLEVNLKLGSRLELARHYLELREFAKLDALRFRWPRLADIARDQPQLILQLEGLLLEPGLVPEDLKPLVAEIQRDKDLVQLFHLRPFFGHMGQLQAKIAAMAVMPEKVKAVEVQEGTLAGKAVEASTTLETEQYQNLFLRIFQNENQPGAYQVAARKEGQTVEEVVDVVRDWKELTLAFDNVVHQPTRDPHREAERLSQQTGPARPLGSMAEWGRLPYGVEKLVGGKLYGLLFQAGVEKLLQEVLASSRKLRLVFEIVPNTSPFKELPWEGLYIPSREFFPGLDRRYSLVRLVPTTWENLELITPVIPPLRILAALSSPKDAVPINIEREEQILRQALKEPVARGNVLLEVLSPVTWHKLQESILRFSPDLLHLVGHGTYDEQNQEGMLLVEDEQGMSRPLTSGDMKLLLSDANIRAIVLNSCKTGSAPGSEDITTSIAGMLVGAGVPVVVATLRDVLDEAALLFSRSFYTSFAIGEPLEAAVSLARKALSLEHFNWTAYAIFSNTTVIDAFRLVVSPARSPE